MVRIFSTTPIDSTEATLRRSFAYYLWLTQPIRWNMLYRMRKEEITITILGPLLTMKSAAWGEGQTALYKESQEAVREAVHSSPHRETLQNWLTNRTKLSIDVEFHLRPKRAPNTDLDSLLSSLFNPLVEGACGPRPFQKPSPQTKDSLFWDCHATKNSCPELEEKTIVRIAPLSNQNE